MSNIDEQAAQMICALARLGVNIREEDTPDDVASQLDKLGLSQLAPNQTNGILAPNACYHELHLEYPAMNLVPKEATPYLWKPSSVRHRESPRMRSFHHDINNLAFFTRFETFINVVDSVVPDFIQPGNVVSAVARVAGSPGISNLEVVAFFANDSVQYRTRLRTTWFAGDTSSIETHSWNYTGMEWSEQIARAKEDRHEEDSWILLLQHLMDRASDRAYLHVRERLRAHSSTLAFAHDQQWSSQWDTASLHSSNSILVDQLNWHEDVGAEFPCGCIVPELSAFYLMNVMTEEEAATFLCPICSDPVLDEEETRAAFFQLEHRSDRRARLKAKIDEQCWTFLPSQLRNASRSFEIAHGDLFDAIQDTLSTFLLPESVLPAETCPTGFAETATVTLCFSAILSIDWNKMIKITPSTMPRYLLEIAENALRQEAGLSSASGPELSRVLPVAYQEFLSRWFSRAITLAAYQVERRDDRVADELMAFMLNRRSYDGLVASW